MDVIILIFFVLLIATLLLGIWQIKNYKSARRNKIKYNCQIVGYGADGKECVRFDNYIDAEKRGMYRHLIKKSVDTGKPYKGILYKEEK